METKIEGGNLIIVLPLQRPQPSVSGKTLVIATTHGNMPTEAKVDGKTVIVGVNAYLKP
jgi:hypothetical protein